MQDAHLATSLVIQFNTAPRALDRSVAVAAALQELCEVHLAARMRLQRRDKQVFLRVWLRRHLGCRYNGCLSQCQACANMMIKLTELKHPDVRCNKSFSRRPD